MPCRLFSNKEGTIIGITCSRTLKCHVCGKPYTSLCDATRNDGTPCDNPMRDEHRITVGEDTDVCIYHNKTKFIEQAIKNRIAREERESNAKRT